jgi:hypothetical protein
MKPWNEQTYSGCDVTMFLSIYGYFDAVPAAATSPSLIPSVLNFYLLRHQQQSNEKVDATKDAIKQLPACTL